MKNLFSPLEEVNQAILICQVAQDNVDNLLSTADNSGQLSFVWFNCFYLTLWRNGSASDSRSEGCVFKSRRGQNFYFSVYISVI